jgi:hypothetical protein
MRIDLTPVDRDDPAAIVLALPDIETATATDDVIDKKVYAGSAASTQRPEAPEMN